MTTETYACTITFTIGDETTDRTFTTRVTIDSSDPITDVSDEACERLSARYPNDNVNILDTHEVAR